MSDTKRYVLTAAIGDGLPGESIDLTDAQAESPLYASRIAQHLGSGQGVEAVEAELAEYLAEGKAKVDALVAEAEAKATEIVSAAQAEAMKLATAKK